MTALALLSTQPAAHALGWTLLHFCWQGTIVAAVLACALALLNGRPPQHRYIADCCALALMIVLPVLTFAHLATAPPLLKDTITNAAIQSKTPPQAGSGLGGTQSWMSQITETLDRSVPRVLVIWFAGVILLLSRLNIGLLAARRMRTAAVQPAAPELWLRLHELSRRLRVARPIKLMNSALVEAPAVIGWLQPVVLIPMGRLTGLSPIQIEALLAHELAHIRRHDYVVNLLQSLVETLLFYHPAVWWISRQIRKERELCCDDVAVGVTGDSLAYAKALSFLEERRSAAPAVVFGANGGGLIMRIRRLLGIRQSPAISRFAVLALTAAAVAAAGLYVGTVARAQTDPSARQAIGNTAAQHALPAVYLDWLNEDVRWIIHPAERAAFLRLTNNTNRNEFIRQFWERRNPPGSPENTFREQYYQRLAYTDRHFGVADLPGWLTDRGRIYILYGPPHAIDSHPSGTAGSDRPEETWYYRSMRENSLPSGGSKAVSKMKRNINLNFVDVCNCGDYRLQPASAN